MGGDKLAIAHNLDDVVQTIIMNYLRGDISRLARLGPKNPGGKDSSRGSSPLGRFPRRR